MFIAGNLTMDGAPVMTILTSTNKTNRPMYVACLVDYENPGRPTTRPPAATKEASTGVTDAVTERPFLKPKDLLSNLASLFWSRWF